MNNSNNLTNFHSHCDFCDGRAPMESFVRAAVEAGFSSYGISSHAPLPEWVGHSMVLQRERVGEYLAEISRLKTKYAGKIELYASMEIDYLDDEENPANIYFQSLPLDYRIGSVHFLKVGPREVMDADTRPESFVQSLERYYANDLRRVVLDYFDAKMRMVERAGFDFVGHADKISMNASRVDSSVTTRDWYRRKVRDYFAFIAQRQMMVEINTKAFETEGMFFPNAEHFALLRELGVAVVVNSDAHRPERISVGRHQALELLAEVGYKSVRELHGGEWQDVGITKL